VHRVFGNDPASPLEISGDSFPLLWEMEGEEAEKFL